MRPQKFISIPSKNSIIYSNSDTVSGKADFFVSNKAAISLILVWIASGIIVFFLFYLNRSVQNIGLSSIFKLNENFGSEAFLDKNGWYKKKYKNPNDAFVFVKINRQYIITSFSSNQQTETDINLEKSLNKQSSSIDAVTKVIKKITPAVKKEDTDFIIKPTPK